MLLERHNIFDLIGRNRRKYHSALVTCYSYDFAFFEERVMSVLRAANIKNVNVFVDGPYLEQLLEHTTGREFKPGKNYTLTPVYGKGVFHPKMMLLLGTNQALLVVGSGNLTGAGICSNDEIWGAFHIDATGCEHMEVAAQAWLYFLQIRQHTRGFAQESFEWIKRFSPWVNDLVARAAWCPVSPVERVQLLYNQPGQGMMHQLSALLPTVSPIAITVIAPFYDVAGNLLLDLKKRYTPKVIHAVVHAELGSIPENLPGGHHDILFYQWEQVITSTHRLHAKLFHFKYEGGEEYLLLGSANASIAAFGKIGGGALNEEACLLLHRKYKHSYLVQLGITIPREAIALSDIEEINLPPVESNLNLRYHVSYAEVAVNKLRVCFTMALDTMGKLVLFDAYGGVIETVPVAISGSEVVVVVSSAATSFKLALFDQSARVSNYQLIHKVEQLLHNNPDPAQEKLGNLFDELIAGDREDLAEMFNYVSHNWADEDQDDPVGTPQHGGAADQGEGAEPEGVYERLSAEVFNTIDLSQQLRQAGILASANVRIADFLSGLSGGLGGAEKDSFEESEETRQLEQGGEGEQAGKVDTRKRKNNSEKERAAIWRYFAKLERTYAQMLEDYFMAGGVGELSVKVTIKSLSHILIALELFQLYYGRKLTIQRVGDNAEIISWEEQYIDEGSITEEGCAYSFIIDLLAKWVLLNQAGHVKYGYELLQNKQHEMRWLILVKAIGAVANMSWNEKTTAYRDTLMLNLLLWVNPVVVDTTGFADKLKPQLQAIQPKWQKLHLSYAANMHHFFDVLLPRFLGFYKLYASEGTKTQLMREVAIVAPGSFIYKKTLGFARLAQTVKSGGYFHLTLLSAGFPWDEEAERCQLDNHRVLKKVLVLR